VKKRRKSEETGILIYRTPTDDKKNNVNTMHQKILVCNFCIAIQYNFVLYCNINQYSGILWHPYILHAINNFSSTQAPLNTSLHLAIPCVEPPVRAYDFLGFPWFIPVIQHRVIPPSTQFSRFIDCADWTVFFNDFTLKINY
jgi:hypothetical protein